MNTPGQKYILLLVEDDPATQESLQKVLTAKGFSVIAADNALEAVGILDHNPVDLILSDVNMPGIDGFSFRKMIINNGPTKDIPFVFLTGRARAEDQVRGLEQGAEDYLTKPIEPDVLIAHIKAILARRENYTKMNRRDDLTGFFNRKWAMHEIDKELQRCARFEDVGCLVFLDIDNFKNVNDLFGHAYGDAALVQLSDVLKKNTRSIDILGRYGGEEFIIYLSRTTKSEAVSLVERLLDIFRNCQIAGGSIRLSFSAGVVEAPSDGRNFKTLCAKADQAMYAAKRMGKAQVASWQKSLMEIQ